VENRALIGEIRTLLRSEKPPDPDHLMRLVLAAMADLLEQVDVNHRRIEIMWPVYRGLIFIAGVFGASVIGLIWGLLTGAVVLASP
jgi:hypothetical protein